MARPGMTNLILTIRGMVDAGSADYTIGGASFWTDNQLQDVLDTHRVDVWQEPLAIIPTLGTASGGSVEYKHYQSEFGFYEETTGGTDIFYLIDGIGNRVGTALWSADYQRGHITFPASSDGTVYYLVGRSYNLNATAADIWRRKAAHYGSSFSFSTDNHRVDRGALIKNALDMAKTYDSFSPPMVTTLYREDVDYDVIVE